MSAPFQTIPITHLDLTSNRGKQVLQDALDQIAAMFAAGRIGENNLEPTLAVGVLTEDDLGVSVQEQDDDLDTISGFNPAKGDLICGAGGNAWTTKAVGTDGQVLKANSAQAGGLQWASAAAANETEWTSYTPTGSWVTNTTYTGGYKHGPGKFLHLWFKLSLSGAPTSASLTVNLPAGFAIDTAALDATVTLYHMPSNGIAYDASATSNRKIEVRIEDNNTLGVYYVATGNGGIRAAVTQAAPFTFASSDVVLIYVTLPVDTAPA